MKKLLLVIIIVASSAFSANAETLLNEPTIIFATIDEGSRLISQDDDFLSRLSDFDRSSRMKTDKLVSIKDFKLFLSQSVTAWNKQEIELISKILKNFRRNTTQYKFKFPNKVFFIKTNGNEEGKPPTLEEILL